MPLTTRADEIIPEILLDAIQGAFPGMTIMWGTGAAVVANGLPAGSQDGGDTIKVPYFEAIGDMEDVPTENDALTPTKLSMTSETNTVIHSGKAVEISHWAQLVAKYADPYAELGRQFAVIAQRRADKGLLTAATAALPSQFINDVFNATVPVTFDRNVLIDSRFNWGDEQEDIALLCCHSKVYKDLMKLTTATGVPLLVEPNAALDLPTFCGVPVKVSDRNTVTISGGVNKYESVIVKKGALAFWYNDAPRLLPFTDALADSQLLAVHMYWLAHRYKRLPASTGLSTKPGVIKIATN